MSYGTAAAAADDGNNHETPEATQDPIYPSVTEWVEQWFAPMIVRRDNADFRWCPQWWAHAEPLSRLTGLWRAWESATTNPDQVNQWWLEHCDPHLKAITDSNGPFGSCSQTKGHQGDTPGLPVVPMPEGWLKHD
jgi:Domain of unknown function (DUF4913)